MVELRSPDLWWVQKNSRFYTRFAPEGPEAGRTQFGEVNVPKTKFLKILVRPSPLVLLNRFPQQ